MGNEMSEQHEHNSLRQVNRCYSSDEEDNRRRRRNSTANRKRERISGSRSSRRERRRDKELDEEFQICNNIMDFGFGLAHNRLGFGFDEDMEKMICQTRSSRNNSSGAYHSTKMFSSVTTVGADGIPVSESRGISANSNGRCKMAHQRRIGDRSQTLVRQRPNELEEFKESQFLREITHDDLPKFRSEFNHRTKNWRSYRALERAQKPFRAVEDGRRSRAFQSSPRSRPVSSRNHRRRSESYKYRPRDIEY